MSIPLVGGSPPAPKLDDLLTGDSSTFASGLGNWTNSGGTLSRSTNAAYEWPQSRPGSLKFVTTAAGQYATCPVPGSFIAGREYHAFFAFAMEETAPTSAAATLSLGLIGTDATTFTVANTTGAASRGGYLTFVVRWVPTATRTGVTLRLSRSDATVQTLTYHLGYVRVTRLTRASESGFVIGAEPVDVSLRSGMALVVSPSTQEVRVAAAGTPTGTLGEGGLIFDEYGGVSLVDLTGDNYVVVRNGNAYVGGGGTASLGNLVGSGIQLNVGPDPLAIMVSEKDANTIQLYPSISDGYDIELHDRGTRHWKIVSADGMTSTNLVDLGATTYVTGEVPAGLVNGSNPTFTLSAVPEGVVTVYKNGLRQHPGSGNDYTVAGDTITFETASIPMFGDLLLVDYGTIGGVPAPAPGAGITIRDEGTPLSSLAMTLDFVGPGVAVSGVGSTKTVTISGGGGGSALTVEELDGSPTDGAVTKLVFPNNSLSIVGHVATVAVNPLTGFIGASLWTITDQTGVVTGTDTRVAFNNEYFDTDGFHSNVTNNSRITIPAGLSGKYLCTASVTWDANAANSRHAWFFVNGNGVGGFSRIAATASFPAQVISAVLDLNAGDYVEVNVFQDSGGNRTLTASLAGNRFSVVKLDSGHVGQSVGAKVYNSAAQALGAATPTIITFDSEDFDTDGFHSTSVNTGRLTIPAGLSGKYLVIYSMYMPGTPSVYYGQIIKNATTAILGSEDTGTNANTIMVAGSVIVDLVAGDWLTVEGYRTNAGDVGYNSGAARSAFSIMRIDSLPVSPNPPGFEFDFATNPTSDPVLTHTTSGTADTVLTGNAVTYDGSTVVNILIGVPAIVGGTVPVKFGLWDNGTLIGEMGWAGGSSGSYGLFYGEVRTQPTAGSHTFVLKGWVAGGSATCYRDGGGLNFGAAYMRVVKV